MSVFGSCLDFPVRISVTLGDSDSIIRPFLLFFLRNFAISRCQLVNVTNGAITSTGNVCFSVATYDNVSTVFPRPISSASNALPEDFSKKSSPSF